MKYLKSMVLHKRQVNISDIEIPVIIYKDPRRDVLLEDIRKNGLKKRIWLKETSGKYFIRDGRHRIACCRELGIITVPALITKKNGT